MLINSRHTLRSALLMLIALTAQAADGPAHAGDLSTPVLKAPVKRTYEKPAHNWTGLYVGGHLGGAQSHNGWFFPSDSINSVAQNPTGVPYQGLFNSDAAGMAAAIASGYQLPTVGPLNVSSGSNKASSWLVGAQLGYNFQFSNNWVLGVEGEASWTSLKGSNVDPNYSITNHTDTDFIGFLAGRFGYAWDRVLLYGKAGGAWAHNNYSVYTNRSFTVGNGSLEPTTIASGTLVDAASVNRFGYMLGAGVEYAISPQWSVKAEYQYLDFGTQRTTLTPKSAAVSPIDMDITQSIHVAKVGFNYKLGPDDGAAFASADRIRDVRRSGPTQRFYGGAEYLRWSVKGAPLSVPLVTTNEVTGHQHYGILNDEHTTILYGAPLYPATGGNDTQDFKAMSGVRLTFGYWFDDAQRYAVEVGGFKLKNAEADYKVSSNSAGSPGLSVPLYNSILYLPLSDCGPPGEQLTYCGTGVGEDRAPVSIPDLIEGSVRVKNTLKLWGLHSNGVYNFIRTPMWDVSAIGGFRYLDLREDFNMTTTLTGISGSAFSGQSGAAVDDFATRNQFYGALLGLRGRGKYGPFSVETTLSTALGFTHETISINGYYNATNFPIATSGPYGIFATPANSGTTSSNKFAVVPEAQVKVGYDITPNLKVTIGYDFIYWSNVVRPTDQINRNVVKGQYFQQDQFSTSSAYPQRLDKTTDFYAHGLNVGLSASF